MTLREQIDDAKRTEAAQTPGSQEAILAANWRLAFVIEEGVRLLDELANECLTSRAEIDWVRLNITSRLLQRTMDAAGAVLDKRWNR